MEKPQPWHHRWQAVDATADPTWYVRFLDASRRGTMAQIAADPAAYFAFLAPGAGQRILDVGTGTGALATALAPLIAPGGRVVGVDASAVMVAEAQRRAAAQRLPVDFQHGDAARLAFPDGAFDRAMANQVLLHLDDPGRAVREMARVVKPGGLVAVWEGDWETLVIDAGERDVTRRLANFFCDSLPQGWIGRALPRLFAEAGLVDIQTAPETLILPGGAWLDAAYGFGQLPAQAERAGRISAAERHAWQDDAEARQRQGGLFVAFTGFRAIGRRV